MNTRLLVVGALVGVGAFAGTAYFINNDSTEKLSVAAESDEKIPIQLNPRTNENSDSGLTHRELASAGETSVTDQKSESKVPDEPINQDGQPVFVPSPISDIHRRLLGPVKADPDKSSGSVVAVHSALDREAKDDSWAYHAEQAILESLTNNSEFYAFQLSSIECRATMCEIQALGLDNGAISNWTQILTDMRDEPWFDFGTVQSWHDEIEGQLAIISVLHKKSI